MGYQSPGVYSTEPEFRTGPCLCCQSLLASRTAALNRETATIRANIRVTVGSQIWRAAPFGLTTRKWVPRWAPQRVDVVGVLYSRSIEYNPFPQKLVRELTPSTKRPDEQPAPRSNLADNQ
jgi:hypothetical protein